MNVNEVVLHAVKEDGTKVLLNLLTSFFRTLLPAFADQAEEIRIGVPSNEENIRADYKREGKTFKLDFDEEYQHLVATSRIKILAGLSIADKERQTGQIFVQFAGRKLTNEVETSRPDKCENLILRPRWN